MNEDQEFKNFIKKLSPEASLPTLAFESRLKKKLLTKNKGPLLKRLQTSMRDFWFGMGGVPYSNFGVLTVGVLFVSVILAGAYLYTINNQITIFQPENQLTAQENYTLLTNIYKNNPQALLSATAQNSLLTEIIETNPLKTESRLAETLTMKPASLAQVTTPKSFNFFHISYVKEFGPLADTCPELTTDNSTIETFTYEATQETAVSFSKVLRYDAEGRLLSFSMTDNVGNYDYLGGLFVARTALTPVIKPESAPERPTATPEEDEKIKNLYGADTIVKRIIENNKEYFQMIQTNQSEALQDCPAFAGKAGAKIVLVQTVDPKDNYRIVSSAYYLDEINPSRLLVKTTNLYEAANYTESEALEKHFQLSPELPSDIEVRDFDNTNPGLSHEELIKTLEDKQISLLLPEQAENKLINYSDNINNVLSSVLKSDYLTDEDFYSKTNWQIRQAEIKSLVDATDELISYELLSNKGSRILVDIIKPTALSYGCNRGTASSVTIDQEEVSATTFESDAHYLCFNFAGYNYQVKILPQAGEDPAELIGFSLLTKDEQSGLINSFVLSQTEEQSEAHEEDN